MALNLSFASSINERTRPIMDGTVRPEGIELQVVESDPAETFWRMLKFGDFDISEMSLSSLLMARERGADFVAIPAFPSRRFVHLELVCHRDSGIDGPEDLVGKSVGVGDYQQTAALWIRGILENDFGVSQFDVNWWQERTPEQSHASATGFTPLPGLSLQYVPPSKSLATMLAAQEIDAGLIKRALRKPTSNFIDRSNRLRIDPDQLRTLIKPVFKDRIAEGVRFTKKHGFAPVNHTYAIRGDIHRKYPWVAFNMFKAMLHAKKVAEANIIDSIPFSLMFGEEYLEQTEEMLGGDLFPYGVKQNLAALQMVVDCSHQQGLTAEKADVVSLFAESTVDL